jgi:hypothetical protein
MEKLTSILAVALDRSNATLVLDRAVTIARCFHARVEVLVSDSTSAHEINAHCAAEKYSEVELHSVASTPEAESEVILRRVWSSRPDLVIKAAARSRPGQPPAFNEQDWELANECPAPILLVRGKPWDKPVRFATAVDVSDAENAALARRILHTAGFLALGTHGNLDILYSEREAHDESVRMSRAVLLAQIVREFHVGCERLQIFSGDASQRLPPLVAARHYDVLVLGGEANGTGRPDAVPYRLARMIDATDSDVVLVKAPSVRVALGAEIPAWQQRSNQSQ